MIFFLALSLIAVTPLSFKQQISSARPGDVLLLTGSFDQIAIKQHSFSPPVVIDARRATIVKLSLTNVDGVTVKGGSYGPNPVRGGGIHVKFSKNIVITKAHFADTTHGVLIDRSSDFAITHNIFKRMRVDGINIALSQRGIISKNEFTDFRPENEHVHPDAAQLWSRPGGITSDVTISDNVVVGTTQGLTAFNHVRDGIDDGGFDRIIIRNNKVTVSYPQGIALYDGRDSIIEGNTVATLPGSRWRTSINTRGDGVVKRDNSVGMKR